MRFLALASLFFVFACAARGKAATPPQSDAQVQPLPQLYQSPHDHSELNLPAGTRIVVAVTSPVWSKSAQPGDSVYVVTTFPVALNNSMAIPPGTYMEGNIYTLIKPTWKSSRAEFQLRFTKIVFANGYTVELPTAAEKPAGSGSSGGTNTVPGLQELPVVHGAAAATVHVGVSAGSDVLLDNGTQFEVVLQIPLALDAQKVAAALSQSKVPPVKWDSATRCRPTAGTPGTSDTVIPGSQGTPGTPDTVIPGGPGMPDIVIPGMPATPGTPDTVIPGSPGTPGRWCPGPPAVISEAGDEHKESFKIAKPVELAGQQLAKGTYQVTWSGPGPDVQVRILRSGQLISTVQARVATLIAKSPNSQIHLTSAGTSSLVSIEFKGKTYALKFDERVERSTAQDAAKKNPLAQ